jgi:AsmA-like C-terminal region
MRLIVRIATIAAALVVLLVASAIVLIYFNQRRVILGVLASIKQQTGIAIVPASGHLEVRDHLIVELDHPRVMSGDHELVALDKIRAVVNFRSMFTHGLPLRELDLDGPALTVPFDANSVGTGQLPRPNTAALNEIIGRLGDLAQITRRLEITHMELRDQLGLLLLRNANLIAYHQHATPNLWAISLKADCEFPKMQGAQAAAHFTLGEGGILPSSQRMEGKLQFSKLPLQHLTIGNLQMDGQSHGEINFSVADDATIEGTAELGVKGLSIRSPDLSAPLELGAYALEARFSTSSTEVTITKAKLTHEGRELVAAQASLQGPYEPNPSVALGIADLKLAWKDILASVRRLKRPPRQLDFLVRQVKSGQIQIEKASIDSTLTALEQMSLVSVLAKLSVNATLTELSFATPPETKLPDVTGASIQVLFAKRTLSLLQGSAKVGKSEVHDIEAKFDLSKKLDAVPYQISMQSDLDLAELRPATMTLLDQFDVHERDRLQALGGMLAVDLDASGTLRQNQPTRPEKYQVQIEPRSVSVGFRGAPGPIGLASGTIIVRPDIIKLVKVSARATGGTADFDGELQIGKVGVRTSGLRVEMHQMPIDRWLEGLVDPDDFSASGNVGGTVVITGDPRNGFLANGKITLQDGRVGFGFLRSPIFVHPAIMTIRDRTLVVSMPAAEFEKSPIDFNISVPDLSHPWLRIDSNVQRLDIEVLKFVRLPWLSPTPTHPPHFPISGHIDAREAILESLVMKNGKTDFKYRNGDWSVDNLTASSMEGRLSLSIIGRKKDDWMHILGKAQNMNVASVFLMSKKITSAPISGRLEATADLWADTDGDFFSTIGGTAILKLRDGNVDRFTLLSRLLEFIDLRSWLTAKVPDPRVSGLQFRTVNADFEGNRGVFHTDNLVLDGPVIDIVASGNVNLDKSTLDMKVGMIPFNTVNWLVSSIPLIGKNVAGGTKSIIAAYFNVRGPITDPHVTPAPISTVAELVKKTLGLPINLIKPDTIK